MSPTPPLSDRPFAVALPGWRLLLAALALALSGCATSPAGDVVAPDLAPVAAAGYVYRVAAGDELNFRFFHTPSLNTVATVRSDGAIALPLLGDVAVAGLTVPELRDRVERALSAQVKRPQVTVNVQGTGSQRVFVGGEVGRPGVQPLVGPLSAVQALAVAEGLRDTADPQRAFLLRRGPRGERQVLALNLQQLLAGEQPDQDLLLQPHDVLVVPRSGIADVNRWVDQYIRRMLPINTGFSYTINRNGTVQ